MLKNVLLLFLSIFGSGVVYASYGNDAKDYVSFHQKIVAYREKLPEGGGYVNREYIGFKNQYSAYGVSGCVLGNPDEASKCDRSTGNISITFPGYSSDSQYKIYVPPGVTYFSVAGALVPNQPYAVAVKMDEPPATKNLSQAEYEHIRLTQDPDAGFQKLLEKEEVVLVHNNGGGMTIVGTARLTNNPLREGRWIYVRVLDGGAINHLRILYAIDFPIYKSWYDSVVGSGFFASNGDPVERAGTHVPPAIATAEVIPAPASPDDPAVLTLKVKHPASEVAQGGRVKYFVVGLIPAQMFAETTPWLVGDVPFFLADFPDGRRWTLLFQGQDFKEVAFDKRGHTLKEIQDSIDIPLVFTMVDLQKIKAKIRFGYTINDGPFKAMDVLWDPRSNKSSDSRD